MDCSKRVSVTLAAKISISVVSLVFAAKMCAYFARLTSDFDVAHSKWAHAANSHESLEKALNDENVAMIESDVIISSETGRPVMAHPPATHGDVTFDEWLTACVNSKKKVIKADFKSIEAAELSIPKIADQMNSSRIWLNADICVGPPGSKDPLNGPRFLELCRQYCSNCTLSLGWTTPAQLTEQQLKNGGYSTKEVFDMISLINENINYSSVVITFPVRAVLVSGNVEDLIRLVNSNPLYSLTVWTSKLDKLKQFDVERLAQLRRILGADRIYFDLPDENMMKLKQ